MLQFTVKYHADVPKVQADNTQELVKEVVTKVLTLKDLDMYDESQEDIHWALESLIGFFPDGTLKANTSIVKEISKIATNVMFVPTTEFTQLNLVEFKKDIFAFSNWGNNFVSEHAFPFFVKSRILGI